MRPSDTSMFRDHLSEQGMNFASVRRVFNYVKSIINRAIREHGLDCINIFAGALVSDTATSAKRLSEPEEHIWVLHHKMATSTSQHQLI